MSQKPVTGEEKPIKSETGPNAEQSAGVATPLKQVIYPAQGEVIASTRTGNTYTFGERLGEGFFGIVFACTDVWGNELAAKVFKPISTYEKVRGNATGELDKLRELRHPNVTFVYDAFEFRDTFYIVTERCQDTLSDLLRESWFKGEIWVMPVARCILQAIHYLHVNGYVHQDIHAGNVLMSLARDEMEPDKNQIIQFKVGDLGVARLAGEVDLANTRADGMFPPEVLNEAEFGPLDHRIDIYHAALLLLQLCLAGELRFTEQEILDGKPRSLALELPAPYSFALEKALRRHVAYRTESAMELWRDLHSPSKPIGDDVSETDPHTAEPE